MQVTCPSPANSPPLPSVLPSISPERWECTPGLADIMQATKGIPSRPYKSHLIHPGAQGSSRMCIPIFNFTRTCCALAVKEKWVGAGGGVSFPIIIAGAAIVWDDVQIVRDSAHKSMGRWERWGHLSDILGKDSNRHGALLIKVWNYPIYPTIPTTTNGCFFPSGCSACDIREMPLGWDPTVTFLAFSLLQVRQRQTGVFPWTL